MNNKRSVIDEEIYNCLTKINELEAIQEIINDHECRYIWVDSGSDLTVVLKRRFYSKIKLIKILNPANLEPYTINTITIKNEKDLEGNTEFEVGLLHKIANDRRDEIDNITFTINLFKNFYKEAINILID